MSRHSEIWDYFEICVTDVSRARCITCNSSLSRGGKIAFNTTNLRKHLRCTHNEKWKELLDKEQKNASVKNVPVQPSTQSTSHKQATLSATLDRKRPWDFDDVNSRRIHKLVGEMVALDGQPFNIVNNEGNIS